MMDPLRIAVLSLCSTTALLLSGCGGGGAASAMIAGTVSGLFSGATVGLSDNGGQAITVSANGDFAFGQQMQAGSNYDVTVSTNPIGETCTVANGTGTVGEYSEDVSNVAVTCTSQNGAVIGNVTGLAAGKTLSLQDTYATARYIGASSATVSMTISANGAFVFPALLGEDIPYDVTVSIQPSGQNCVVANGKGTIPASGGIDAIQVTCN